MILNGNKSGTSTLSLGNDFYGYMHLDFDRKGRCLLNPANRAYWLDKFLMDVASYVTCYSLNFTL